MKTQNYLKDISDIKNMMSRSSRFISLSGLSGILAGIYALIGALAAYFQLQKFDELSYIENQYTSDDTYTSLYCNLIGIALIVLFTALVTGFILTLRKAKKQNEVR